MPGIAVLGLSTYTLTHLLDMWGYPIVIVFVAVESAGIPFPGETMLVLAAIYAGAGHLHIQWVIAAGAVGAILGDNLGYAAGRLGGRGLVERYGRYIHLRAEQLQRAEDFFQRHGDPTVFFGRFVAVLRAWVAFLAGVNLMPWPKFLGFNAAGGITWAVAYGLLGYFLGNNLPLLHQIERIVGVAGVVAAAVVVLAAFLVWRRRQRGARAASED
jgi:membrane protein DedA with SNARE-associated domain